LDRGCHWCSLEKCQGYNVGISRSLRSEVRIETDELYFLLSAQERRWHDGWLYRKHTEVRMEMDGSYLSDMEMATLWRGHDVKDGK
jgi:hypothetical protein